MSSSSFHVIGVGGPGMSALARLIHGMGHHVSGCDAKASDATARLQRDGVTVRLGNDDTHVNDMDFVTHSSAVPPDHHELRAARSRGARVLTRGEALSMVCRSRPSIGVAGTHGKTTTTAMLSSILIACDGDPSYLIGGETSLPGSNAHWGGGDVLVVEADESDSTHLALPLSAAVVTNVDVDHLDNFGSFAEIMHSFERFVAQVDGPVVVGVDDPGARSLVAVPNVLGFGIDGGEYRANDVELRPGRVEFTLAHGGSRHRVVVGQRGIHNVRNALGALAIAHRWGVDLSDACAAMAEFRGVSRRFDVRGSVNGTTFVDDYAHLPAEIAATLAVARAEKGAGRVVAVFQPNRFNRMEKMSGDYRDAFVDADVTLITEIYASGTAPIDGVSGSQVVDAIRAAHPHADVRWCPTRDALLGAVIDVIEAGDLCVSMGCGDVEHLPSEVMSRIGSA